MCLIPCLFLQSESDSSEVMKLEFGDEDAEEPQEIGLAARLTKKVKKDPKERGTE